MHRVVLALVAFGLSLGGCLFFNDSPQERQYAVCYAYCDCITSINVDECITDDCMPVLPFVSDACFDCVSQNSNTCSMLDDQCTDLCFP